MQRKSKRSFYIQIVFRKFWRLWDNVQKYFTAGQVLKNLIFPQWVYKFPEFYGTQNLLPSLLQVAICLYNKPNFFKSMPSYHYFQNYINIILLIRALIFPNIYFFHSYIPNSCTYFSYPSCFLKVPPITFFLNSIILIFNMIPWGVKIIKLIITLFYSTFRYLSRLRQTYFSQHSVPKSFLHISMFHRAFFNSIIDKTPTHALHCTTRVTTHTWYMYCCHNAGADHRDFKFSVLKIF